MKYTPIILVQLALNTGIALIFIGVANRLPVSKKTQYDASNFTSPESVVIQGSGGYVTSEENKIPESKSNNSNGAGGTDRGGGWVGVEMVGGGAGYTETIKKYNPDGTYYHVYRDHKDVEVSQ